MLTNDIIHVIYNTNHVMHESIYFFIGLCTNPYCRSSALKSISMQIILYHMYVYVLTMLQKSRAELLYISNLAMQVQDDINGTSMAPKKNTRSELQSSFIMSFVFLGCYVKP